MNETEIIERCRLARFGKNQSDGELNTLHRKAVDALFDHTDGICLQQNSPFVFRTHELGSVVNTEPRSI